MHKNSTFTLSLLLFNMTNREPDYSQRIATFSGEKQMLGKKQKSLPALRLGLFLLFAFLVYRYLVIQSVIPAIFACSAFVAFVIFSLIDSKLKKRIKRLEILVGINQKEVDALEGNYEAFDPGNEFIDPSHDYTHDLDIFGKGSLFQFINRTATIFGKLRLAEYFGNAFGQSQNVIERQQAINELSAMIDLRQNLQLIFHEEEIRETDKIEISSWLDSESPVRNLKLLRILAFGLPAVTFTCIILSLAGIITFPVVLVVIQLIIVFLYARQTMQVHNSITSKSKILNKIAQCLVLIEKSDFKAKYLKNVHNQLVTSEGLSPSKSIHQLSVILKYMDSNLNILVSIFLNGLFMFNLHLLLKVEKWKKQNRDYLPAWFESIATVDALSSLANFAYNHPDYAYPLNVENDFEFTAENLGHPLIAAGQCVTNNIHIKGWNQFAIITGANMSGKSTFLRTIGVNYILAMAGAPVCASKLDFYPIQIHSSIRTSDSLVKHESYFYAELKRLKQIIDELESGKKKLILLDEILKGTNSRDKQAGSIALIEQLLHYKSVGLFATHDLMLGELAARFPGQVNNLCFEIQIENDKMQIDYKLHDGVCKNLNATYLMRNMGILFETKN